MVRGPLARMFWFGAAFMGIVVPIHLLSFYFSNPGLGYLFPMTASTLSLAGLLLFEDCYIRAGQAVPLS
jgi:formate-dependent nitrite reductase membrane component NrfD